MKKLLPALFFAILTVIGLSITSRGQTVSSPTKVTRNFYAKYITLKMSGLPTNDQVREISPFVSDKIKDLIAADRRKQVAFLKKHPDEKPPWIEGDLFSSLSEGADSYKVGSARKSGNTAEVDVHLSYGEGSQSEKWTDTAVLKLIGGRWVIDNILFKGKWQSRSAGSLIKALR